MAKRFPVFLDITEREIYVFGAGKIAARRAETLSAFSPRLTVYGTKVNPWFQKAAAEGKLVLRKETYHPGSIPLHIFMVLAATDNAVVNEKIYLECREKGILVNVCSNQEHCDFHFPGIASKGELVIGINAGGHDHCLAKKWTDRIRKEVEEDGYDDQAEKTSDNGKSAENGAGNTDG